MEFIDLGSIQSNKFPVCELVLANRPFRALVDTADLPKILSASLSWHARWCDSSKTFYVQARHDKIPLHRLITDCPEGMTVDHWNHDGLDNRRANLRVVSQSINSFNRRTKLGASGYRGVTLRPNGRFRASVMVQRRRYVIGDFATPELAAQAVQEFLAKRGVA